MPWSSPSSLIPLAFPYLPHHPALRSATPLTCSPYCPNRSQNPKLKKNLRQVINKVCGPLEYILRCWHAIRPLQIHPPMDTFTCVCSSPTLCFDVIGLLLGSSIHARCLFAAGGEREICLDEARFSQLCPTRQRACGELCLCCHTHQGLRLLCFRTTAAMPPTSSWGQNMPRIVSPLPLSSFPPRAPAPVTT